MDYLGRIEAAREAMTRRGVDVLLIGQPANRQYLSGFGERDESPYESAGWIVLTRERGLFVTGFNYFTAIETSVRHLEPVKAASRLLLGLIEVLNELPAGSIGFEGRWVSHGMYHELIAKLGAGRTLVPVDGLVDELRVAKDQDELAILRRAIRLTDDVYSRVVANLRIGQTEREIAWAIERGLRERGAEAMAFGPDVAAGPNAAVPHHQPTDYAIRPGDPVWIDLGARLEGYCSDLTRSFCVGEASTDYLTTWNLVLEAQRAALAGLRADLETKAADALARAVVVAAGRGDEFGHPLGHGLGLMIHEAPLLGARSDERLRSGMVVTVEPGLYRAGWGGIRIEDVALIEPNGANVLSDAPKAPIVAGGGR